MPVAQPKPKKKTKAKRLTVAKVQDDFFNKAIVRRDSKCVTCHTTENLQASHFIAKGGSGGLRFYPLNVHAQCSRCHRFVWHMGDVMPYVNYMKRSVLQMDWMEANKKKSIRYNQETLQTIKQFCINDQLEELTRYIEGKIGEMK